MQRTKKIIIIGVVAGLKHQLSQRLGMVENNLKDKGWDVINPLNLIEHKMPWDKAVRAIIRAQANCDAVYMTTDWDKSQYGGQALAYAHELDQEIIYQEQTVNVK